MPFWSIALTELFVLVAIPSVRAAKERMGLDTLCPDGEFYPSWLAPVGRIFRISPRIIYSIRAIGLATIMVGCRHPPAVLDAILIAIEENPWRESQEMEVSNPAYLTVLHPCHVYHPVEEYYKQQDVDV